jgi:hypothetical protein
VLRFNDGIPIFVVIRDTRTSGFTSAAVDVGHPAWAQLHAVVTVMRVSKTWHQFKLMRDVAHPKRGDTLQLPLMAEPPAEDKPKVEKPEPPPGPKPGTRNH